MPSTKRIVTSLGKTIAHEHGEANVKPIALLIKQMMENAKSHSEIDNALDTINDLLHGCGVEVIEGPYVDCYYMNINLLYVNMGDTYTPTIVYDTKEEEFYVCSWGDIVKSQPKRFDV